MGIKPTVLAAILAGSAVAAPVDQLRAASPYNYVAGTNSALAASQTDFAATIPFVLGSGDFSSLALVANNWALAASGSNAVALPGNTVTIQEAWLEYNGQLVQWTFGGSNTRTLTDGEADVVSSEIAASSFSLSSFPRGATGLLHIRGSVPVAAQKVPTWNVDQNRYHASFSSKSYAPASTTPTLGVGGWTFSGTAPTSMARHMPFILVGRFVSGDPRTFLGAGDSMYAGTYDVNYSTALSPRGYFMRALYGAGGAAALGGITCALSGAKLDGWFASTNLSKLTSLVKYCSTAVENFGLNQFPTANAANAFPTGQTTMQNQFLSAWANMRAAATAAVGARPFKVVRPKITVRISSASVSGSSPDQVALATAGQAVYGPQWDIGGDAKLLQDWMDTKLGAADGPDYAYDCSALVRASTDPAQADYYKFQAGLNTDQVHFGHTLCPVVAADFRTALLAISA